MKCIYVKEVLSEQDCVLHQKCPKLEVWRNNVTDEYFTVQNEDYSDETLRELSKKSGVEMRCFYG